MACELRWRWWLHWYGASVRACVSDSVVVVWTSCEWSARVGSRCTQDTGPQQWQVHCREYHSINQSITLNSALKSNKVNDYCGVISIIFTRQSCCNQSHCIIWWHGLYVTYAKAKIISTCPTHFPAVFAEVMQQIFSQPCKSTKHTLFTACGNVYGSHQWYSSIWNHFSLSFYKVWHQSFKF